MPEASGGRLVCALLPAPRPPLFFLLPETPFSPSIKLPSEIKESQSVTLICTLNYACPRYPIRLEWSLKDPQISPVSNFASYSVKNVYTESKLTFQPKWTDHGKNVTCRVLNLTNVLSENTVRLDVKRESLCGRTLLCHLLPKSCCAPLR